MYPEALKYTKEHEWVKVTGNVATIGITHHAQDQLGDIVYVDLPTVGAEIKQNAEFGVVESVKSVSSLFAPISGKVAEINEELNNAPQLINQDPYDKAWIMKIEITIPTELDNLLSAADYKQFVEK